MGMDISHIYSVMKALGKRIESMSAPRRTISSHMMRAPERYAILGAV